MLKKGIFILALVFTLSPISSQVLVDSLYANFKKCKSDSCQLRINNLLFDELIHINQLEAERLADENYQLAKETDLTNYVNSQYNYGFICLQNGKNEQAYEIYKRLNDMATKSNDLNLKAKANFGMAKYFVANYDYKKSIEYAFNALRLFEKLLDHDHVAKAYGLIALINLKLKNEAKAIDYFKKVLEIGTKHRLNSSVAYAYNNLGIIYSDKRMHDFALEYYRRALNLRRQMGHVLDYSAILTNMGTVYSDRKDYNAAEKYYKEALEQQIQNDNKKGIAISYINIGNVHYNLNDFKEADHYYREALKYLDDDYAIREFLYYNLGEVNEKLSNYKDALRFSDTCMTIKDSLYSREAIKSLNDMQVKYETEKTKLELEKKDLESKNNQIIIYAALGGIVLLLGLVFFIFRGYKNKEKTNLALEDKNKIITEKNKIVEEQHKDITDSIKYAERIQTAILPPDKLWKEILPESFVFYNPKDILSGDFYWIEETKTHVFLAAADCTGHGVPGALVSIVNYNLLNKAVLEKELNDPAQILDQVNIWLTQALHQSYNESNMRDGMDVALCVINKKTKLMKFAGAFNSGYVIKDNAIHELVADKKPVGAFIEDDITSFTSKEYQLTGKETVYLFTDGYADQFGGPKGKKFKYKNLQNLFLRNQPNDFDTQKTDVQKTFLDWKGGYEQTDDVLVIGFKYV